MIKATTRGARLVCRTVFLISSSSAELEISKMGSAREASKSAGESCSPGLGTEFLTRFDGEEVVDAEDDVLFFETRFAAERICFASFSSGKIDCMLGRGVLDRLSGLQRRQRWITE